MTPKEALEDMLSLHEYEQRKAYYLGYEQAGKEMVIVVIFWCVVGCIMGLIVGYGFRLK